MKISLFRDMNGNVFDVFLFDLKKLGILKRERTTFFIFVKFV